MLVDNEGLGGLRGGQLHHPFGISDHTGHYGLKDGTGRWEQADRPAQVGWRWTRVTWSWANPKWTRAKACSTDARCRPVHAFVRKPTEKRGGAYELMPEGAHEIGGAAG